MQNRLKVLWLPAWYPSRQNFLNGDFVERHAHAVSKYADVIVVFVIKLETLPYNKFEFHSTKEKELHVYSGYYNCNPNFGIFSRILSVLFYLYVQYKLYRKAKKIHSYFNLCHVYITEKQALLAIFLKKFYKLKYLLSEQNGWFMPIGDRHFPVSKFFNFFLKTIFKNATAIHPVSKSLSNVLQKKYSFLKQLFVIPNVVNGDVFFPSVDIKNNALSFFAVTGNTYTKNTDGIIRAFSNYIKKGYTATLDIAGPNIESLVLLSQSLAVSNVITFHNAIPYEKVALLMKKCDAFIFFTRHETFGCVMIEALFCGKPVIATRIPVLQENLVEFDNALFVTQESEEELTEKLIYFTNNTNIFNNSKIAFDAREKFNYNKIGLQFLEAYNAILIS